MSNNDNFSNKQYLALFEAMRRFTCIGSDEDLIAWNHTPEAVENIKIETAKNLIKQVPDYYIVSHFIKTGKILKEEKVRSHNVGSSDYAKHKIQPWDIWIEYKLNPWDADIVKRVLRKKSTDTRKMDYEKIIHICQERIRQIEESIDIE